MFFNADDLHKYVCNVFKFTGGIPHSLTRPSDSSEVWVPRPTHENEPGSGNAVPDKGLYWNEILWLYEWGSPYNLTQIIRVGSYTNSPL